AVAYSASGCARARARALGECSRLAPVTTIFATPASRARWSTASRSWSKLSWVRLAPMSTSCMGDGRREEGDGKADYPSWMESLPIAALLPEIRASLGAHPRLVLEAPPGAGKTTQVPLALLDAPWLQGRRIVMLEPRRVAARAAAGF